MTKEKLEKTASTMRKKITNNQTVVTLVITLLILLIIFMLNQVAYVFKPLGGLFDIFGLPLIAAAILYYLLAPVVRWMTGQGIERNVSIWILFISLVLLIVWGILSLVPILRTQFQGLAENLPYYAKQLDKLLDTIPIDWSNDPLLSGIGSFVEDFDFSALSSRMETIISTTFGSLGTVIGNITQVVLGLLTMPIVLYYMLLEGNKLPKHVLYYLPNRYRETAARIIYESHSQISRYIRGQIIVAIIVAIIFAVGYSIIGLDYGISFAIFAGFCNVIPYLGSFIAVIPVIIIAVLTSPLMLLKVLIVMSIEQFIEGRFVSPQILGSNLQIHPVTILVVLLGAGRLFGIAGVILGVPGYAVVKVFVSELYQVYRNHSEMYGQETIGQLDYVSLAGYDVKEEVSEDNFLPIDEKEELNEENNPT
ncbi:AI-2E family transporter [Eremococcus coleocola]|uniref:ATP synthase F0, A subunit n=1 Tax=Eremococcus coleocola ACS-139-V-Col8 TaxID=908337 RepID=E4KP90_9LACT|nr:AI-2E family transporter [Eremococcus coleocola]EFR31276.1 hypothetical protein HMPREF9257_1377 [Eremococcus coleocola ACS-139-V-Col8]